MYGGAVAATRKVGRIGADLVLAEQDRGDWSDAPSPDPVIVAARVEGRSSIDLGAGLFAPPRPDSGQFVVVAPGTATSITVDVPHTMRIAAVNDSRLPAPAGDGSGFRTDGSLGALHAGVTSDEWVTDIVGQLRRGSDPRAACPAP